ncbi:MAG TPA: hypothetical protein EYP57_07280 [Thermodesulfobacteriaceae bacterium]|nr:hypothetical protein [Thermodesulfobacteriaceae bacterium]
MRNSIAIAIFTLREGLKQRIIIGLSLAALIMLTSGVMISGFFMRDISKIVVDLALSVASAGGLMVPFFVGINMLAGDIEKRTIFTIMAQPVSRWHYVIGKYIGLSILTLIVILFLASLGLASIWVGKLMYGPVFFKKFSMKSYLVAVFFNYWGTNVLLSLVVMWSSITTSSFLSFLLTLASYLIGNTLDDIVSFVNTNAPNNPMEETIQTAVIYLQYAVPNLSAFDLKLPVAHGIATSVEEAAVLVSYGAACITFILMISILTFNRRNIA